MASVSTIRPATAADLDAIAAAERVCFPDPWSREALGELLGASGTTALVATTAAAGTVVGYLIARAVLDEAEILNVVVLPGARRAGLGGQLIGRGLEALVQLGARAIFLEVRESNRVARDLYERHGFRPIGVRAAYYRSPVEDAIGYRWESSPASKR
ncbi:MAG: ribosomal-protein-alanine N-acetyltransferase [Gemmatimonadetes bacterium]|nr:ribosomal-protein-alanine N-acetyltransferase [Gemmatimonadota bacterium]